MTDIQLFAGFCSLVSLGGFIPIMFSERIDGDVQCGAGFALLTVFFITFSIAVGGL